MYPGLKVRLIYVPGNFPLLTVRHLEGHCRKNVKTHTRAWKSCESLIMVGFFWRRTTPKDICCWFGCATQENTIKLLLTSMVLWDSSNICTTKDHDYWKSWISWAVQGSKHLPLGNLVDQGPQSHVWSSQSGTSSCSTTQSCSSGQRAKAWAGSGRMWTPSPANIS